MSEHALQQWLEAQKRAGKRVLKRDLANDVECSPSRITQILNGEEPSLSLAAKLSKRTGIPLDKFAKEAAR